MNASLGWGALLLKACQEELIPAGVEDQGIDDAQHRDASVHTSQFKC